MGFAVRPHPREVTKDGSPRLQVLVAVDKELRPLRGADSRSGFSLGPALNLYQPPLPGEGRGKPYTVGEMCMAPPVWDSWSASLYFMDGAAVMRLVGDEVTRVAGSVKEKGDVDGADDVARFTPMAGTQLVSDGAGNLWYGSNRSIRRIQLPPAWCAQAADVAEARAGGGGAEVPSTSRPSSAATEVPAAAAAACAGAVVTTLAYQLPYQLPFEPPHMASPYMQGLAFVPSRHALPAAGCSGGGSSTGTSTAEGANTADAGGSLIFATQTAFYRIALSAAIAATAAVATHTVAGAAPAPAAKMLVPELVAGEEGQKGNVDGPGAEARLSAYAGLVTDAAGNIYFMDGCAIQLNFDEDGVSEHRLRRLSFAAGGGGGAEVTTLLSALPPKGWDGPFILPNGYLALCSTGHVGFCDLGLRPRLSAASNAAARAVVPPPSRTLHADMAALLDAPQQQQPDGAASDVAIRVGERRFHAHRAILSARCDYFKQRLTASGGFADGRAAELELPDADADAFALLLRWLYTGDAAIPPSPGQACAVAELADRLLLPELCAAAARVVLDSVSPATVVDSLLWADRWSETEPPGAGGSSNSAGERAYNSRAASGPFGWLRAALVGWYAAHHAEVRREAGASVLRLARYEPRLAAELMDALAERGGSCSCTCCGGGEGWDEE
ncbi:hypothetical protein HYH02_004874 [Chlamydomonas schloesseri]|uniref:BTB domain-containing protein n=1 Tax=Chlamydomonas schloesseri TaxID=2026947 RepID=A0A836B8H4_9CHLO|nr:hypothetical protein HYH02_004874 [Chlamydomonas schloesseri]|eukprot:KAG2450369.1 hypothetical protein HYH02_004874 [Chlamydomonas schloesseri]